MGTPEKLTLTLESRKSLELPLSQLLRDGEMEILPHVETRGLLFLQFRKGRVTLTAGKYVGIIPLTPTISVDVRPKLPISNLARVLDRARVSLETIEGVDRLYQATGQHSSSVLEFLLSNLLDALRPIRVHGLHKEYVRRSSIVTHPRGRIQVAPTLQSCRSRGLKHKVWAERFEQTSDVAVNRSLRSALEFLLTGLRKSGADRDLVRRANEAYCEFPDQIGSMSGDDYDLARRTVSARSMPADRRYYYRALEIALLVLSGRTVSLDKAGEDLLLDTFIVDFEAVFEQYLRRALQAASSDGLVVKDGNREGKKPLFDDRSEPSAEPDIVILNSGTGRCVIAEVKYKERPNRADINQAATYALTYRTNRVVLVHQFTRPGERGLHRLGSINGVIVEAYGYDLASADLEAEERAFAGTLFGMLPAQEPVPSAA